MNTSNITNDKPKDFVEYLMFLLKHLSGGIKKKFLKQIERNEEVAKELQDGDKSHEGADYENQ